MLILATSLLTLAALALFVAARYGRRRWNRRTRMLRADLDAVGLPAPPARVDFSTLAALPAPVQRYLRTVLQDGAPLVAAVEIAHAGRFNLAAHGERWKPFVSTQRVTTRRPGFVWDGRIRLLPGLTVHVHDAYVAGEGLLQPALLGLFRLPGLRGTREVAAGELMRYLAEAAWYPSALLPGQGVHWEAVDAQSARASLSDGATTATLLFRFGDDGLVQCVRAEARGRLVGNQTVPTPWEGCWSNYQWRAGMQVPLDGEAAWLLPDGRQPYWRGRVTTLACEFSC